MMTNVQGGCEQQLAVGVLLVAVANPALYSLSVIIMGAKCLSLLRPQQIVVGFAVLHAGYCCSGGALEGPMLPRVCAVLWQRPAGVFDQHPVLCNAALL
jgi:hypothetical protein